ncbi:hypothetical protein E2C01_029758 [Portunus trituberculatus]|uniref:Uncharacterized protein n=1 Tax=Portunus trituberculatus TaxID=210409 RepID=A0A5B7EVE2_PORTR|nr:hypothetical protein [Portunus trituberculatus]
MLGSVSVRRLRHVTLHVHVLECRCLVNFFHPPRLLRGMDCCRIRELLLFMLSFVLFLKEVAFLGVTQLTVVKINDDSLNFGENWLRATEKVERKTHLVANSCAGPIELAKRKG